MNQTAIQTRQFANPERMIRFLCPLLIKSHACLSAVLTPQGDARAKIDTVTFMKTAQFGPRIGTAQPE